VNIICDLDGVLFLGDEAIPGAGDALADLTRMGASLLFVTNSSTKGPAAVAAKIGTVTGYPAVPDQVITSGMAAVAWLAPERPVVFLLGAEGTREGFEVAGCRVTTDPIEAEVVVVGLDFDLSYQKLAGAVEAVHNGARLVATNTDPTYPTPRGQWPGAGALVAAVVAATGASPVVAGKPHEPVRRLIRSHLGDGSVLLVGDRPETDLAMAHQEGWTSVLVLTGVVDSAEAVEPVPDHVLDSIASLPALLAAV
jgi:HAD superfamily hydrolase (TIGR01450 family)